MNYQKVKQVKILGGFYVKPLKEKDAKDIIKLIRAASHNAPSTPLLGLAADNMEMLLSEVLTYRAMFDLSGKVNALRVRGGLNDL